MTRRRDAPLGRTQKLVLHLLASQAPCTARDLAYHWPSLSESAAMAAVNRLADRGLVDMGPGEMRRGLCRNRACVNPAHMEPVTSAENSRRGNRTRLTKRDVEAIRSSTESCSLTARRFGVTPQYVGQVRSGKKQAA